MGTVIPPFGEAEKARIVTLIARLSRPDTYYWNGEGDDADALRACLARAEQADKLEQQLAASRRGYAAVIDDVSDETKALRQRAEQAEQQIIPVADRERALWVYPVDKAEARSLLKLASTGTRTEEP